MDRAEGRVRMRIGSGARFGIVATLCLAGCKSSTAMPDGGRDAGPGDMCLMAARTVDYFGHACSAEGLLCEASDNCGDAGSCTCQQGSWACTFSECPPRDAYVPDRGFDFPDIALPRFDGGDTGRDVGPGNGRDTGPDSGRDVGPDSGRNTGVDVGFNLDAFGGQ